MQDIIESILRHQELLNQQISDIQNELRTLHWEDDVASIQILQSELDVLAQELVLSNFVNCTSHAITIEGLGELPPSGILPRVEALYGDSLPLNGVRVRQILLGAVTGLPNPVEGLSFIVSGMVLDALRGHRKDCYAPDTGMMPFATRRDTSLRCGGWFNNQPSPCSYV